MGLVSSSGKSTTTTGQTDGNSTTTGQTNGNSTTTGQTNGKSTTRQPDDATSATSSSERKHSIIIGVSVTLVLIGLGIAAFFWMRRRHRLKREKEAIFTPHQFVEVKREPGQALSIIPNIEPSRGIEPSGKAATNAALAAAVASQALTSYPKTSSPSQGSTGPALSFYRSSALTNTNTDSQSSTSRLVTFPYNLEVGYTEQLPEPEYPATAMLSVDRVDEEGEIVFQHRDGGRIIRELPPPYPNGIRPKA
jgi:hypothetical protein